MKLLVFGQPASYASKRDQEKLIDRVERSRWVVEQIDPDSREGIARMEIYGVVTVPAWVVTQDDGSVVELWQHTSPRYEDLAHALGGSA